METIPDDAPRNAVLATGGRLLILGADEWQQTAEDLSPRWRISAVTIPVSSLQPRTGDLIVWRGIPREDPDDWYVWGGPTRIVAIADSDKRGHTELCVLEDASFADAETSDDDLDELENFFAEASDIVPQDGVVAWDAEWDVLNWWQLAPHCPRCGSSSRPIVYGLVADPSPNVLLGGCTIGDGPMPRYHCDACGHTHGV